MNLDKFERGVLDALHLSLITLRDTVTSYRQGGPIAEGFNFHEGICGNVLRDPRLWDCGGVAQEVMRELFLSWPDYSGVAEFPVPGRGGSPILAFLDVLNKWNEDCPYCAERMNLLRWMIGTLGAYLHAPKPVQARTAANPPSPAGLYKPSHGGYPGTVR